MNSSDIIVGVSRELTDVGQNTKWNHKKLTWIITHNDGTHTRQHIVELLMTLISSERIVKVDGEQKLK